MNTYHYLHLVLNLILGLSLRRFSEWCWDGLGDGPEFPLISSLLMMGLLMPVVSCPTAMTPRPCYPLSVLSTGVTEESVRNFDACAGAEEAHVGAVRESTGLSISCILRLSKRAP